MSILKKTAIGAVSFCLAASAVAATSFPKYSASVADAASEVNMEWGTLKIGGGGFVSGIVTGKEVMYARTDVGGAYKYNYDPEKWEQLFGFLTEADRGLLSVDAMAIDPTDDDTVYFLCGCAYFSGEKSVVFKTTDGGKTFKEVEVTEHIKVMGNGDGRQCGESIAVNPDNPKEIYAGGDVVCGKSALIKSTDGGETWEPVMGYDDLGFYENTINYPTWTDHLARAVTDGSYQTQNGVAAITISNGKVYVGTSINGKGKVHVPQVLPSMALPAEHINMMLLQARLLIFHLAQTASVRFTLILKTLIICWLQPAAYGQAKAILRTLGTETLSLGATSSTVQLTAAQLGKK